MSSKFRKAVFIVTYRKEKDKILYLLLKRKLHWRGWEFPKGGLEDKEKIDKAVRRELKEETGQRGFNFHRYRLSGKYKYNKEYSDRKGIKGQTWRLFSAEVKDKKIKVDRREHSGYRWENYEKAVKMLKWENQKRCLKVVNNKLNL